MTLLCPKGTKPVAVQSLEAHRRNLVAYMERNPDFKTAMEPWKIDVDGEEEVVRRMCAASALVELGPMSAVAGTLAQLVTEDLLSAGARYALADNGGDIFARCPRGVTVGIYGGRGELGELALKMPPRTDGWSVCTSSGTVGPSISLGCADAAVTVGNDGAVCDAAATALGNRVRSEEGLESCFKFLSGVGAVEGALVLVGRRLAKWGRLPPLCRARVPDWKVTRGR